MRKTWLALAMIVIAQTAAADSAAEPFLVLLRTLLNASAGASFESERAAFIIASGDRSYTCALWPRTNEWRAATWHGPIPSGTIAIAHTHPETMPQPSQADIALAARLKMPLFVVSRQSIYAVHPGGGVQRIARGPWTAATAGRRSIQ